MFRLLAAVLLGKVLFGEVVLHAAQRQLSWSEAVALARAANPALKAAQEITNVSESNLKAAKWKLAPELSAELSADRENRFQSIRPLSYSMALGLKQNLFDDSFFGGIAEARANLRFQSTALVVAKSALMRDLKKEFAALTFVQSSLELAVAIIRRRERNLGLVTLRFEGGRENAGAVQLSQANLLESRLSKIQAENSLLLSQSQLRSLLGLDDPEPLIVTGNPPTSSPPLEVDFRALAAQAPEFLQTLYQEEQGEAAVRTARGRLLPSLGLIANVGRYGEQFVPQEDGWMVAINLSIPFGNGANYHHLAAAHAQFAASTYRRVDMERKIRDRIIANFNAYTEAVKSLEVATVFLRAAETRAEIAREKYEMGLISFDEWERIESDLVTSETAALRASRDRINTEADWEYLIGRGGT